MTTENPNKEQIHARVTAAYGAVARAIGEVTQTAACCSAEPSTASDYTAEELASVPRGAYLGEGSGAPVRYANLEAGEVVVDLGAGAGMDSFLAANQVGPAGRVYAYDLTEEMLDRARCNATSGNYAQVTFARADIEQLPLGDGAVDAAISNCVINLAPDKAAVYREIFRVLRPGGRLSIADIVLRGRPEAIERFRQRVNPEDWCACVSGALEEQEYLSTMRRAGFTDIRLLAERPAQFQPDSEVAAVAVTLTARKPT